MRALPMILYDAHNHFHDERLEGLRESVAKDLAPDAYGAMVVNGTSPKDWEAVAQLADRYDFVIPSFGVHPWQVGKQGEDWQDRLESFLQQPNSAVGEIGLDRWIPDHDLPVQEEVFLWQLRWAAEHGRPVSIHCLKAWGRLESLLRAETRPEPGFLLHSYGGPAEMVQPLAELGAYFSISGYFAHERKARQCETFRSIPLDRLLVETDAPDMWPPDKWNRHPLQDEATGKPLNHPANLAAVYDLLAELRGLEREVLGQQVANNFRRLFGSLMLTQRHEDKKIS